MFLTFVYTANRSALILDETGKPLLCRQEDMTDSVPLSNILACPLCIKDKLSLHSHKFITIELGKTILHEFRGKLSTMS